MQWEILLSFSILLGAFGNLFHRLIMKQESSDARAQTVVYMGLGGIIALVLSIVFNQFEIPTIELIPKFIFLTVTAVIGSILMFNAYKLLEASSVVIFMASQPLWTMFNSFIFLNEQPTFPKIIGASFIFAGIVISVYQKGKLNLNKGAYFALLAAFIWSFYNITGFSIVQTMSVFSYQFYGSILPAITLLLFQPKTLKKIPFYFKKTNAIAIVIVTFIETLVGILFYMAYQNGRNASEIMPLGSTQILFTVIFAILILKERKMIKQKILGVVIASLGSFFILYFR